MVEVEFHQEVEDHLLTFAVIIAFYKGQYVLCQHKDRDTFEFPGGKRETGESILECAKRELYEETGAMKFELSPVGIYSVTGKNRANVKGGTTYGMLYKAEVFEMGALSSISEIKKVICTNILPTSWTYPDIQPYLLNFLNESIPQK